MKVAIAGAGKVGRHIAGHLSESGHDVLMLEEDHELAARIEAFYPGVRWHIGDACEVSVLRDTDLNEADVMIAATGDDEDNLVISLLAKQEFAVPRVVARVNHPKNYWLFNETWGVDVSVSTPHLLTALVEEAVSVGSLVQILQFAGGEARLVEVTLDEGTPAEGQSLATLGFPRDATVVAIVRERHVVVPRGDTMLQVGDEVLVLVTPDSESAVRDLLIA